jgi:hypothetical protein
MICILGFFAIAIYYGARESGPRHANVFTAYDQANVRGCTFIEERYVNVSPSDLEEAAQEAARHSANVVYLRRLSDVVGILDAFDCTNRQPEAHIGGTRS